MCLNPLLWEGFLIFFNIKWNLFLSFICLFPLSFFRPGDSTETREREDPGLHSVSPCAGTPCGLLWRPLHRQTSLRVRRHHCFQRQLPWPSQWEARVEEIHWWASTNVLLCKRQVSNSCQRRTNYIGVKRKLQIPLEILLQEIAKRRRLRRLCCYELTIQIKIWRLPMCCACRHFHFLIAGLLIFIPSLHFCFTDQIPFVHTRTILLQL